MNILEVKNLKTYFYGSSRIVKAVDDVSFEIKSGEVFSIVGGSGSGKTLTALSILRLISWPGKIIGGQALFNGKDLLSIEERELRKIRGTKISVVFQEPASSFNPVFTIGEQIVEAVITHQRTGRKNAAEIALEHLKMAQIEDPKRIFHDYPHQLSGGTKQRAMIAMALVNSPELMILDEPTTALDVTIQAQILDLLEKIIQKRKLSILFISHDLGIVARMASRIAVMHEGSIVEAGDTTQVLSSPKSAYTISLLESVRAFV